MPGIILSSFSSEGNTKGFSALYGTSHYGRKTFINQSDIHLAAHIHDLYPFHVYEKEDEIFIIEGEIYNTALKEVKSTVLEFVKNNKLLELNKFIASLDGEFILILVLKDSKKVFVINDQFGRLPLYFKQDNNGYAFSREIQFLLHCSEKEEMNQMSVAHQLLFGYTLGEHTLWDSIKKVEPHSMIEIDLKTGVIKTESHFNIAFKNEYVEPGLILKSFEEALFNRIQKFENKTLSLSGGLDSRLIAGVLKQLNIDVPCATYSTEGNSNVLDVEISKQISGLLKFKSHEVFEAVDSKEYSDRLLHCKAGLNFLAMGYILPFHEQHVLNKSVSITGDGGDKFFIELRPLKKINSAQQFLNYLFLHNGLIDLKKLSKITGISEQAIKNSVLEHVLKYPTSDWNDRYAQFIIRERGINWLFEGEDRCRYFTWTTSPFYSPKVTQLCYQLDEKYKIHGKLFNQLFNQLPGDLGSLENPNWKCAPNDKRKVNLLFKKQQLKSYLPHFKKNDFQLENFKYYEDLKNLISESEMPSLEDFKALNLSKNLIWNLYTILRTKDFTKKHIKVNLVHL